MVSKTTFRNQPNRLHNKLISNNTFVSFCFLFCLLFENELLYFHSDPWLYHQLGNFTNTTQKHNKEKKRWGQHVFLENKLCGKCVFDMFPPLSKTGYYISTVACLTGKKKKMLLCATLLIENKLCFTCSFILLFF